MTREGERELVKVEHVNGGDGYIVREAMVTSEEVGEACKMYAKIHLDPGCEVGYHYHHGETESYFILTGHGTYDDNGEKQPANPGDLFLCKDGDAHGIKNTGDEELTFMALILKNNIGKYEKHLSVTWIISGMISGRRQVFVLPCIRKKLPVAGSLH